MVVTVDDDCSTCVLIKNVGHVCDLGHQQKKIPAEIFHLEVVIRGFGDRGVDRFPEVCGSI